MRQHLRIATRQSPLALWQAEYIKQWLEQRHPGLEVSLLPMTTQGDRVLDRTLNAVGGKGLFVKELELALLDNRADIAVHSMKDVPAEFPEGLELAVICQREYVHDALVSNQYTCIDDLPIAARVGTASLRRQCQLRAKRPDLQLIDCRGNVGTRLSKLDAGELDALILAEAGLRRLELHHRIAERISDTWMLPAAGQGALGIECRAQDHATKQLLADLHDPATHVCVTSERALTLRLDGGCQLPVAAYAILEEQELWLRGLVGSPDGRTLISSDVRGPLHQAEALGHLLAERLLAQGANDILDKLRKPSAVTTGWNPKLASLKHLKVLITRPEQRGATLAAQITALGGEAVCYPLLRFEPVPVTTPPHSFDAVIFVSVPAVEYGLPQLVSLQEIDLFAVGQATSTALHTHGLTAKTPTDQRSEGLLALPELQQVAGKHFLLVQGEGGRSLLAETLKTRGAIIISMIVYRRVYNTQDISERLPTWRDHINTLVFTSGESLETFYHHLSASDRVWCCAQAIVVVSPRIKQLASQLGFRTIHLSDGASDHALINTLLRMEDHARG